jgi:hypothetical protein
MPIFTPLICLMAMGLAVFRRSVPLSSAGQEVRDDVPARLLRWAVGLLSAQRAEWGQAMLGELDHIDGWGRRWRFAAGCAGGALLLPPWRVAGTLWGGSAAAGRRIARLAGFTAGLGMFLYGTLAVAVIGAAGANRRELDRRRQRG